MSRKKFGRQKWKHYKLVCKGTIGEAVFFKGKRLFPRIKWLNKKFVQLPYEDRLYSAYYDVLIDGKELALGGARAGGKSAFIELFRQRMINANEALLKNLAVHIKE